jgi:hypothetical protein
VRTSHSMKAYFPILVTPFSIITLLILPRLEYQGLLE